MIDIDALCLLLQLFTLALIVALACIFACEHSRTERPVYRHVGRGTLYAVLHVGVLESTTAPCVIYAATTGAATIWVRDYNEFIDGRFVLVSGTPI